MDEFQFIGLMRDAVWVGIAVASPVLIVALVVGLAIGLLQALTSIQELTLTFVPKLVAILLVFWLSLPFMEQGLVTFFQTRIIPLVAGG
ncbi:MAG: flagellar biosynthetic protein FliQ [Alphaproteobacteria bacterium]